MSSSPCRARRATLDDIETLRSMWGSMRFSVPELEKQLTDFQVVQDADGLVVGGVGFHMSDRHGLIDSEAFSDFAVAETARALLWERIQTLAANHGIVRIWTREPAPFWKQHGLVPANPEALSKLPGMWNEAGGGWLTLALRDEQAILSIEKELAMLMAAEKQRTARTFQRARIIKYIATSLAVILAIFVAVAVLYLIRNNPGLSGPPG